MALVRLVARNHSVRSFIIVPTWGYGCPKSNSHLSEDDYAAYQAVLSRMGTRYSTAKVPDMNDPNKMLELEPDLTALMYSGATEATQARFLRSHFLIGC